MAVKGWGGMAQRMRRVEIRIILTIVRQQSSKGVFVKSFSLDSNIEGFSC